MTVGDAAPSGPVSLYFDANDPLLLARFWAAAHPKAWEEPEAPRHRSYTPHRSTSRGRRLVALGAGQIDIGQGEVSWAVMADSDDNEFYVLTPDRGISRSNR